MAARYTRHDSQNYCSDRAGGECVDRSSFGYCGREHARAEQCRSQNDPKISDVQHCQKRLRNGGQAPLTGEPQQVEQRGENKATDWPHRWQERPTEKSGVQRCERNPVDRPMAGRMSGLAALDHPVSSECADNPAADRGDQRYDADYGESPAKSRGERDPSQFKMHEQISNPKHRNRDGH
jgi:hypothetical protein